MLPGGTTMSDLVTMLKKERDVLKKRVESLEHAISGLGGDTVKAVKKGMSAATKAKLSIAAKKRWAKVKKSV
jgi:hypothetical protein